MNRSFSKNYIYIYIWQGVSVILNLVSLFIVIPHISRLPEVYGIYSICIAISMFLQYSDIGFMNAGYKYASECFARSDRIGEIKIVGFVTFILLIFVSIYFVSILYLSFHPEFLIKEFNNSSLLAIASEMLLIQAFSSVIIVLQRCLQIIYGVRLEDYIYQRILIVGNILKIISIFYFFREAEYQIVGYYLFIQVINILCLILGIWVAKNRYQYDIHLVFSSIRFSKEVYNKTKRLAFSAFLLTLCWILYYELDTFVIARIAGARAVSYYAIGLTMLSFCRSSFGILFNPFNARFNHFIGLKDSIILRKFYLHVMRITLPLVVLPILSLYVLMPSFVVNWVGRDYLYSIDISKILILSNILAFITYPTAGIVIAEHKIKLLNIVSFIYPLIFWLGILLTYRYLNILSFAVFKLVTFMIAGIIYLIFSIQFLKIRLLPFLKKEILPIVPSLIFIVLSLSVVEHYLPMEKSKQYMLITIIIGALASFSGGILYYVFSNEFREYVILLRKRLLGSI